MTMHTNQPAPRYIGAREFTDAATGIITAAKHSIKISTYLISESIFAPSHPASNLAATLILAPQRTKNCRLLVCSAHQTIGHHDPSANAIQLLIKNGWKVRRSPPQKKCHAKVIIADATHLLIGSHNLNDGSLLYNHEASLHLQSAAEAYKAEDDFDAHWAQSVDSW